MGCHLPPPFLTLSPHRCFTGALWGQQDNHHPFKDKETEAQRDEAHHPGAWAVPFPKAVFCTRLVLNLCLQVLWIIG